MILRCVVGGDGADRSSGGWDGVYRGTRLPTMDVEWLALSGPTVMYDDGDVSSNLGWNMGAKFKDASQCLQTAYQGRSDFFIHKSQDASPHR